MNAKTEDREVLPTNVRPTHYELLLEPFFKEGRFRGEEIVTIDVREATREIVLNAVNLDIKMAKVEITLGENSLDASVAYDSAKERAILTFDTEIPVGKMQLLMEFEGPLTDKLVGLYRSAYTLPDGTKREMAVTQFEANHARKAFPCWDEPSAKATFTVNVIAPIGAVVLSNTDESVTLRGGEPGRELDMVVEFKTTPLMSTYLLAIVVGDDLECMEGMAKCGVKVRVWATLGKKDQCVVARDFAVKALDWFTEYFGVPYPIEKMDLIAVPDFAFGAMENWGCITFREPSLLIDPANTSKSSMQRALATVAHEIAHQWFGNLVTMEWWNDLWLNEGFATWIGNKCVNAIHPEWDMWTQFAADETATALRLDALRSSHPIEVAVPRAQDVDEVFDAISYDKSGSIIRMLEAYLGEEKFRDGLRLYMKIHANGNTEAADLWRAIEEKSGGVPVVELMSAWTKQTGFPLITFSGTQPIKETGMRPVHMAQRRFLAEGVDKDDETTWRVPMRMRTGKATTSFLLDMRRDIAHVPMHDAETGRDWFWPNADRVGLYRSLLTLPDWGALLEPLRNKTLTPTERLAVIDDAYALSWEGSLPATVFVELAEACDQETDFSVLCAIADGVSEMTRLLRGSVSHAAEYRSFVRRIFGNAAERLGWEPTADDGHGDSLLRPLALRFAGNYGNEEIVGRAKELFVRMRRGDAVHPDLRASVYGLVAVHGDDDVCNGFLELYRKTDQQEEKRRLLIALCGFRDQSLLRGALDFCFSAEVRGSESRFAIETVGANSAGCDLAWEFVRDRWSDIVDRYRGTTLTIGRIIGGATVGFMNAERHDEVKAFFEANKVDGLDRTIQQTLERIRLNARWVERQNACLARRFADK